MTQAFEQLEKEFGEFIGNPNTVAVSSGTAALHIACEVARTKITDDVTGKVQPRIAVPEYTMVACPRAARMADMQPVFVDCLDNLQMNTDLIPSNVDAIMAVHIYGNLCDISNIHSKQRIVIEDMAEVHGAIPHPKTFAACWSFYKNKTIHGEEGGMIAFKDSHQAAYAKKLRTLGFDQHHDYFHVPRGVNARMSNSHACLILQSLADYKGTREDRLQVATRYDRWIPEAWQMPACSYPWIYPLRIRGMKPNQQREMVLRLNIRGIAARQGFKSMGMQTEFHQEPPYDITNAMRIQSEIMYLPLDVADWYAAKVCDELMNVAKIVIPLLTPTV